MFDCLGCNKKTTGKKYCSLPCYRSNMKKKDKFQDICKGCGSRYEKKRERNSGYCTLICYRNYLRKNPPKAPENVVENLRKKDYRNYDPKNIFSLRWELLYKIRPDLHDIMRKIEWRLPIG